MGMRKYGNWIFGDITQGYKDNTTSHESLCISELKSCLSSYGSIICHHAWLYCTEESLDFPHDQCCFLIRDEMLAEFQNIDYRLYNASSSKRVSAAMKKKV